MSSLHLALVLIAMELMIKYVLIGENNWAINVDVPDSETIIFVDASNETKSCAEYIDGSTIEKLASSSVSKTSLKFDILVLYLLARIKRRIRVNFRDVKISF